MEWFSLSKGSKERTTQPERVQPMQGREGEGDPALAFESVEEMKLNFPFVLPGNFNEGRTAEEKCEVMKVMEEAHHAYLARRKSWDDQVRRRMEVIGSTYTLEHQLRLVGNSTTTWLQQVEEWQKEEKWARTASAAELEGSNKKNPLVKLLLHKPAARPEPTSQAINPPRTGRRRQKRKQVMLEDESDGEEEQQIYVADLDTFVPVDLVEFMLGDPTGNEEPMEEQGETQGMDEYLNLSIVPAGVEDDEEEEEPQLTISRRRGVVRMEIGEVQEEPVALGRDGSELPAVGRAEMALIESPPDGVEQMEIEQPVLEEEEV